MFGATISARIATSRAVYKYGGRFGEAGRYYAYKPDSDPV
jgi:hypothetical protein